jgi:Holliday junction DNA helicase RuvA
VVEVISLIQGEVAVRRSDHVVISCSGVGYQLAVSSQTLAAIPQIGKKVTLSAHLVVREDALQLYGFATEDERELFRLLIGVQSVGPKLALALLSGGSSAELLRAVSAGDVKQLCEVPGVGKRTAERIIVELREKVGAALLGDGVDRAGATSDDPITLAREALLGLGFTNQEASGMLERSHGSTAEELIADALRASANNRQSPSKARV